MHSSIAIAFFIFPFIPRILCEMILYQKLGGFERPTDTGPSEQIPVGIYGLVSFGASWWA